MKICVFLGGQEERRNNSMGNIDCIQLAIASIFKICEMGNQGGKEIKLGKLTLANYFSLFTIQF